MPATEPYADLVDPDFHQVNLEIEDYLKFTRGYKLDADDQICKANLSPSGCPLGPTCPRRHTLPSAANFQPPTPQPYHPREKEKVNTICKHFIRGLCIMGDKCEFLHEYNLTKFPECWWWSTYGFCTAGDECLYWHPKVRRRECVDFNRGFCKLGPDCPRTHIRRVLCPAYVAGFCPAGPDCKLGHPPPDLPPPEAYLPPDPPITRDVGPPPPGYGRYHLYTPYDPAHWQVWHRSNTGNGFPGGGGGGGAPQGISVFEENMTLPTAAPGEIPPDLGKSQGGNAWRYAMMVNKGFIKPVERGQRGWKSEEEMRGILCFRCNTYGHYASMCTNAPVAGDRGGLSRRKRPGEDDGM
ncbi:RNA-binding component of cleavage and polyadenylation factor [Naganishia albida]|nr:RNA-binding component of cleavage and polyadenylation factor [Naganishia albida]